jgi:aspartate kinase
VALVSALGADACEIYIDAGGIFTADPAIVADARLLPRLGYSEMLAMCPDGRHEPEPRAVELACERRVELRVRPVLGTGAGTVIAGAARPAGVSAAESWTVAA